MTKVKYIIILLILSMLLFFIPNISNGATEEYTYTDTQQGITWSYELDNSNNVINLKCKTSSVSGTVTIPSTIEGKTVLSLKGDWGDGAFQDCAGLTGIVIPQTITTIGEYAFDNCSGLKSITIPDSVTTIGGSAFRACAGLTSITFSKNLTSIGSYAFVNCSGLKSITIPDSVTTIGEGAFQYCSGLKDLTLSNHLSKINDRTFEGCSGLISVKLPESVTTIEGGWANIYGSFGDCSNLQKILIPDSVASIGQGAFRDCPKLTIYGNDNMVSKQYAEENDIPFDYIANWDKANSGSDISAPTVKSIYVTYASVMNYSKDSNKDMYIVPSQAKLTINVEFSEIVQGTTVPTLTIKFGDGQNIQVTEGTIGGSTITYIYTIKSTDKGTMSTVDYKGGDIKDAAGNVATLSCPALGIQYSMGDFVYANGTATNPSTSGTTNNGSNSGNPSGGNTSGGSAASGNTAGGNTSGGNATGKNTTGGNTTGSTAQKGTTITKLPYAGVGVGIFSFIVVIGVSVFSYFKYRNLRDL